MGMGRREGMMRLYGLSLYHSCVGSFSEGRSGHEEILGSERRQHSRRSLNAILARPAAAVPRNAFAFASATSTATAIRSICR